MFIVSCSAYSTSPAPPTPSPAPLSYYQPTYTIFAFLFISLFIFTWGGETFHSLACCVEWLSWNGKQACLVDCLHARSSILPVQESPAGYSPIPKSFQASFHCHLHHWLQWHCSWFMLRRRKGNFENLQLPSAAVSLQLDSPFQIFRGFLIPSLQLSHQWEYTLIQFLIWFVWYPNYIQHTACIWNTCI